MTRALAIALLLAALPLSAAPPDLLDALRYQESRYATHAVHCNSDGSRDEGPYQLNSRYLRGFEIAYNHGHRINPFDAAESRRIASAYLDDLHRYLCILPQDCGVTRRLAWYGAVTSYNCGLLRYLKRAPIVSLEFARRVVDMAGYAP